MIKRKTLGQHFLKSVQIAKFIVDSGNLTQNDVIYEIGTGQGILIPFLCEKSKHVITIEKDKSLYKEAVDKFYTTALENGATDEGKPGSRSDGNYYSYIRDLDGNKITARCVVS